ncbi:MAG: amidohydrolase family protein, partial [Candidatus Kariarchaeaceae archaeon]
MKRIDQWIVPDKIYDAHHHLFSYQGLEKRAKRMGYESLEKMVEEMSSRTNQKFDLPDPNISLFLKKWVNELDQKNVDKSLILADWNDLNVVEIAMEQYSDRFIPFLMLNPKEEGAFKLLEDGYSKFGIKGFKLYPPLHYYHAYEEFLNPFYEFANDHNMLITYHMGV